MSNHLIDEELAAKLRLAVNPPGKKASCLNELSSDQLIEVYHMLKSNSKQWNFKSIARFILQTYGQIGDVEWVADKLSQFSDQVLGPRRGLAKMKGEVSPDEKRVRDRYRKLEERAKKQLSEITELGSEIIRLQDMVDYWDSRGRDRGEPFNEIAKYESLILEMAKARHTLKIAEGLVRPPAHQVDGRVNLALQVINQNVSDTSKFTRLLSSFKRYVETIAEPVQVDKLIPEKTNENELRSEDDQAGDGSIDAEFFSVGDEHEYPGTNDH
jgi:hypothetical protein